MIKNVVLTVHQEEAIISILKGNDTLVLLPTGGGKSWIYQFLPLVLSALRSMFGDLTCLPERPVIPVISPLNALIDDQIQSSRELGLEAVKLDESVVQDIKACRYSLIFGSPELWLDNSRYRDILLSRRFYQNCVVLVVDEVHKVTW